MDQPTKHRNATVRLDDLRALTELGLLRLPSPAAESRRTTHMRTVVAAASDLDRALASQIRCMLVNCQGSHGAGDLPRETEELHAALMQYAELVHDVGPCHHVRATAPGTKTSLILWSSMNGQHRSSFELSSL